MKGRVLFYNVLDYSGIISGEDGLRYDFVKLDWQANGEPREGLQVDFSIEDGKAKEIFVVVTTITHSEGKGFILTLVLAIFLGPLGIHRFYTGHIAIGVIQLLTAGGCGIWYIIDIILIVTDSYRDFQGNPLVKDY